MTPGETLAEFVRTHGTFTITSCRYWPYQHMGATITDAVLQAGISYEAVVLPRVLRLRREYAADTTTSRFVRLLEQNTPEDFLGWRGRKIVTLLAVTGLLQAEAIETEEQFRAWLKVPDNVVRLRRIRGVKRKTTDYFLILLGEENVAVDRHIMNFLKSAGLRPESYEQARQIVVAAAALLGIAPSLLDHSIWRYMSERARRRSCVA